GAGSTPVIRCLPCASAPGRLLRRKLRHLSRTTEHPMNRWTPATLIVLGVSSIALAGEGSEKPVKPSDLPAAVTASVQQHYPGATIHEASQETREGVRTWEAGISIG